MNSMVAAMKRGGVRSVAPATARTAPNGRAQRILSRTRRARSAVARAEETAAAEPAPAEVAVKEEAPKAKTGKLGTERWSDVHGALTEFGLKTVGADEAKRMVDANEAVIIDISATYYKEHIDPSVSVPYYRSIKSKDMLSSPNRFFSKFTLLNWPELNPDFESEAKSKLGQEKRLVIVSCQGGGTLSTDSGSFGQESRSLRAAYALIQMGITNVATLDGGISQWKSKGYEMAGKKYKVVKKGKWFVNV